jgi:hypothetical protein
MVIRKSACLNILSLPSDVDLLIDLYSQAQPLLSSAGLSEMEGITVLAALVTGASYHEYVELHAARQRHEMNFLYNIVARRVAHVYTYS